MVESSQLPAARAEDFGDAGRTLTIPLRELLDSPETAAVLVLALPHMAGGSVPPAIATLSLLQIAAMTIGLLPRPVLAALASQLASASAPAPSHPQPGAVV